MPAAQIEHEVAASPEYDPPSHASQNPDPEEEKVPARHGMQSLSEVAAGLGE